MTGRLGCTTTTIGETTALVSGTKSRSGSYERLGYRAGLAAITEDPPSSSVYPSGLALATSSVPMIALPPGRFSTTTAWFMLSCILAPTVRATKSLEPPAVYGTMMRMGWLG